MKNFKLTALAISVSLSLTGCFSSSSKNEEDSYVAPVVAKAVETPFSIQVVDENGELISANIKLSGSDVAYIVEVTSGESASNDEYTAEGGTLMLSSLNIPDSLTSLSFDIVVTADGYFANSAEVSFSVEDDSASKTITLSSKEITSTDLAVKSVSQEFSVDESSGATSEEITFSTSAAGSGDNNAVGLAGSSASVKIPTGTIMTDSDGNTVTGTLTAALNYYSNEPNGTGSSELSALAAFPGGFDIGTLVDSTTGVETEESFNFVTAGFVAMEINDENGNKVKDFSEPVDIAIQISADTINPDTGVAIKPGDTIPTWSYEETTGKWSAESAVTVGSDLNTTTNTYTATMSVNHLSYWNLDWHYGSCAANPLNISFENADGNPNNAAFEIKLQRSGYYNRVYGSSSTMTIANSPTFDDLNVSVIANGEQVLSKVDGISVGSDGIYTGSFCDLDGTTITLDVSEQEVVTGNFTVNTVCENDNSVYTQQPAYVSMYTRFGSYYSYNRFYTNANEAVSVNDLYPGSVYNVWYYAFGQGYGSTTITVGSDENQNFAFDIPVSCELAQVTGGTGATGASGTGN